MKKCPFCAEEIQDAAIKCKHCGSMLTGIPSRSTAASPPSTAVFDEELKGLINAHGKIHAIKALRQKQGMGLAEAKTYVDSLAKSRDPRLGAAATPKQEIGTAAGFLIAIVAVAGAYFFYARSDPASPGAAPAASQSRSATATPTIDIIANDLVQAYRDNEVAADQKFKGRTLLVSGVIDTIGKDVLGTPYITLMSGEQYGFRSVQAMFPRSAEAQLAARSKGEQVRIQGRCDGMFGNVLIKDSVLR